MKKLFILHFLLGMIMLASCSNDRSPESKNSGTKTSATDAATVTTTATATSTTITLTTTATVTTTAIEPPTYTPAPEMAEDIKLLKAAFEYEEVVFYPANINGGDFEHYIDDEVVDFQNLYNYMSYEVGTIPIDRVLGTVTDEQDAIEKARYVLLSAKGQKYMDWLEKEPEHDPDIELVRESPPIVAKYIDEYDVWFIHPTAPKWKRADGTKGGYDSHIEFPKYMVIRGSDGKLLGTIINY